MKCPKCKRKIEMVSELDPGGAGLTPAKDVIVHSEDDSPMCDVKFPSMATERRFRQQVLHS